MATICIGNSKDNNGSIVYVPPMNYTRWDYSSITSLTDNGSIISLLFGPKQTIEWEQFKSGACLHLKAKDEDLEVLKFVLSADSGYLDNCNFSKFLRWFSPLVPDDNANSKFAWKISTIAKLIRQPWFHGFTMDTSKRLKHSSEGTFLVRFGCQAPHFVLALKDGSTESVMEWRVLSTSGCVGLQNGERFQDLQTLVDNYTSAIPCGASCTLARACV